MPAPVLVLVLLLAVVVVVVLLLLVVVVLLLILPVPALVTLCLCEMLFRRKALVVPASPRLARCPPGRPCRRRACHTALLPSYFTGAAVVFAGTTASVSASTTLEPRSSSRRFATHSNRRKIPQTEPAAAVRPTNSTVKENNGIVGP